MQKINDILNQALNENALLLDEVTKNKLVDYLERLSAWNRVFNLTSITEPREMVYLHLIDSLVISPYLQGSRLLDVGTGAGLPGLPLAILNPHQHWVLLDKNSKKTRFLTQVIAELSLANVEVIHQRSEDFHPTACFDSILSRAFGTIPLFAETTEHLLCPHGILLAMKGKYPQEELDAIPTRFLVKQVSRIDIKGTHMERHIVCLALT